MESEESLVKRAAHLMVASLAGSLALVTCREPLRVSLTQNLRQVLQPAVSSDCNDLVSPRRLLLESVRPGAQPSLAARAAM